MWVGIRDVSFGYGVWLTFAIFLLGGSFLGFFLIAYVGVVAELLEFAVWLGDVGGAFDVSGGIVDGVWWAIFLVFIGLGKIIGCFWLWFWVWFRLRSVLALFLRGFLLLIDSRDELDASTFLYRLHEGIAARYMTHFLWFFVLLSTLLLCSRSLWELILHSDWALRVYFRTLQHIFRCCWLIRFLCLFSDCSLAILCFLIASCPADTEANDDN